jgi:methylated-DNA-[protein]-cysteine S-methyltransferase
MKTQKTFNERCYEILKKVPRGKVTTYGSIARKLKTKAYRAVGNAMNKNPHGFVGGGNVPCHRVVGSNGDLTGFASGLKKKTELLKKEGVEVENGKVDLKRFEFKL